MSASVFSYIVKMVAFVHWPLDHRPIEWTGLEWLYDDSLLEGLYRLIY